MAKMFSIFEVKRVRHFIAGFILFSLVAGIGLVVYEKDRIARLGKKAIDFATVLRFAPRNIARLEVQLAEMQRVQLAEMQRSIADIQYADKIRGDKFQGIEFKVDGLVQLAANGALFPPNYDNVFHPAEYSGSGARVFSLFDEISLYQKNGAVEIYGASLRQRMKGAITVEESQFAVTHSDAWLFWSPDAAPAGTATHLRLQFVTPPENGTIRVGFILGDRQTYIFERSFGPPLPDPVPVQLPPLYPRDLLDTISGAPDVIYLNRESERIFSAELPPELRLFLRDDPTRNIQVWFIQTTGMADSTVRLTEAALIRPTASDGKKNHIFLAGKIGGGLPAPGSTVTGVFESGDTIKTTIAPDGIFRFSNVPRAAPMSIRYRHKSQDYYTNLGRWFVSHADRSDLFIGLQPRYINDDAQAADPAAGKFITPRKPSPNAALYEHHARQYWPGGGKVKEYDSLTFTNNRGFIDRDRFFDNSDNCFRVVHLGSSHAVALQVMPFEKFNIELESRLATKIGRCVEVISAGRDNGDVGSNYPRVESYAVKFRPDVILFENSKALIMQLHPELLKWGFGWDADHNALDGFFFGKDGTLQFRPWDPSYPVFTTKPTFPELVPGIPFFNTLMLPGKLLPSQGQEAFKLFSNIMEYMQNKYPDTKFVVHTALDQAQCRANCTQTYKISGNKEIDVSVANFIENHDSSCAGRTFSCINVPLPVPQDVTPPYLTFEYDGHYSVRGHQWLAESLAEQLVLEILH